MRHIALVLALCGCVVVLGCSTVKPKALLESHMDAPPVMAAEMAKSAPSVEVYQAYIPSPTAVPPVTPPGTEDYAKIAESAFRAAQSEPLSTFSADVDTASYSNVRRYLRDGMLPPADAVRVEELVNYFPYDYPEPEGDAPFSVTAEMATCPWAKEHRLARIGIRGKSIDEAARPASNLVFLVDVSGSMTDWNKLPLVKQGLRLMVQQMRPNDHVAMVTYAGSTRVALQSTRCTPANIRTILEVIDGLGSGGSTHGSAGIKLAYTQAEKNLIKNGTNRVVLATDGDFNVGVTSRDALEDLIVEKAKKGVFLTVLGFGMGNLKDSTLETLADKGNGHYAYIDSLSEARKVLLEEMSGTLVTIAKDVKLQVEFNPVRVAGYRLVGYENRLLAAEDFNDDTKDAGEIGAGHTVTALYEVVPAGKPVPGIDIDALRYQKPEPTSAAATNEAFTVKVRYKEPKADESKLLAFPVVDGERAFPTASESLRFAAAVAAFGQCLRGSPHMGDMTYEDISEIAQASRGTDEAGYRAEFVGLVKDASVLAASAREEKENADGARE